MGRVTVISEHRIPPWTRCKTDGKRKESNLKPTVSVQSYLSGCSHLNSDSESHPPASTRQP